MVSDKSIIAFYYQNRLMKPLKSLNSLGLNLHY